MNSKLTNMPSRKILMIVVEFLNAQIRFLKNLSFVIRVNKYCKILVIFDKSHSGSLVRVSTTEE